MYTAYKVLHIAGIAAVFAGLGALAFHAMNGGTKDDNKQRPIVLATHGIGLVILLVTGFGMMARLVNANAASYGAVWLWLKIGIWLVAGGLIVIPNRAPKLAGAMWVAIPILALLAAAFARQLVGSGAS
jgi:hypothetical protein